LGIVVAGLSPASAAASRQQVAVIVVPAGAPVFESPKAAHGLVVPGQGATVTRDGALASLLRGS
jgi:hypothetical protein